MIRTDGTPTIAWARLPLALLSTRERRAVRLEELRTELRAERISYGDLAELQGMAEYIEPGDVELLEAAGVPEYPTDA